jgi:molybdopterin synthase sulfur carrier subunit
MRLAANSCNSNSVAKDMITVEVILFATLRDKYGRRRLEVECDGTVRNLIENAARKLGHSFLVSVYDIGRDKVREDLIFAINGRNIKDLKGKIELKNSDVIAIFPPVAGG